MPDKTAVNRPLRPGWLCLAALGMAGCGGVTGGQGTLLTIDSTPAGADVTVMGEHKGVTPLELSSTKLFPATYPADKQALYGKVRISYPGCAPQELPISSRALEKGLHVKLECHTRETATPGVVADTPVERLKRLEALRREGLLDEQEYLQVRQRIIDSL